ncbi:RING-H2 finger protein ATL74 [Ziziphus jujuba]|uniref:RING-type E3 ubiquitin transferase n=2 Tax=Ziziphus jujuba TaxID=326968 RepID=A0A6P4AUW6_ZIZJJ|nr:RING-H2 finger protein ATL74 [Ziziphus jujuba]
MYYHLCLFLLHQTLLSISIFSPLKTSILSMAQTHPPSPTPTSTIPCHDHQPDSIDFNIMVIMAAIICAFVCALGLNSTLQCVFRCANRVFTEPVEWVASRRINSGLKKREMVALPTSTYENSSPAGSPSSSASECAICLVDFCEGDKIRVLPKCKHRFHVVCIDTWLLSRSSCPNCRNRLKSNDYSKPSLEEILTS